MTEVRTRWGVFSKSIPRKVPETAARSLNSRWDFIQLAAVKYKGPDACRSLRMTNGNIVALLKDTINFVPISIVYKLVNLKEFEIVPEEEALPDLPPELRPLGAMRLPWTTQSRIRRSGPIDISSIGDRQDGSHGTLSSKGSSTRYRLGVFVARPQGYVSGGYYHVWMTANVLCRFFDVTVVVPAMPIEYVKLAKHPELKIVLDTNYLLDLGYSPFDMIMSLHGTCGEAAAKFSTRYNVPVYLHCFEPGNLVLAKQPGQERHFNDRAWGFRRELYKRVDYVVTSNPYCQAWTRQWIGEDPRKIVACVPPLNFKIADGVPEQDERHEVVFISRMVDYKRPMDVLEVVQRVDRDLTVNFIGTHSSLSKRVADVAQREKIRANFYIAITEEEKFRIIKRSKFMIFPSGFEGYGLPPAEALYCKKPCVAYDIPILRENYKDVLEFAKDRETLDLCAKAKRLLDDPEYRRQRGIEGRSFIKNRLSFEACENSYIPIMPPTRISFFVIVFEGADYLRECLTQLYPFAWEILVAEGAVQLMADHKGYYRSQDGTSEILDTFPDPEKKIRTFKIENRPWKDKAEMKHVLLKESEGHILWQVDSITKDRLIWIRHKKKIKLLTVEECFNNLEGEIIKRNDGKEIKILKKDKYRTLSFKEQIKIKYHRPTRMKVLQMYKQKYTIKRIAEKLKLKQTTVSNYIYDKQLNQGKTHLCNLGEWTPLHQIIRHKTEKECILANDKNGQTEVTQDHSLIEINDGHPIETNINVLKNLNSLNIIKPFFSSIIYNNKLDWADIVDYKNNNYCFYKNIFLIKYHRTKEAFAINRFIPRTKMFALMRILGAYISEGSCSNNEITFVTNTNRDYIVQIKKDLKRVFGLEFQIKESRSKEQKIQYYLRDSCFGLKIVMQDICGKGAENKYIPEFIFGLPLKYQNELLKFYIKGDGYISKDYIHITTISPKLCAGIIYIMKSQNKWVRFSVRSKWKGPYNHKNAYQVTISKKNIEKMRTINGNRTLKIQRIKKITNDYVYDLNTKNGIFVDAMGMVLLHNSDEFYKHDDIRMVIQEFIDDASLDLIEAHTYHFWKDYNHYRMDGKWGQVKFTRIWRKRGQLTWTYHDCPHRDGKPYRGTSFKGKNVGRILYHYGYVRDEESVFDKIEFMSMRDMERNKVYHKEYNEWLKGEGKDIREFQGEHPEAIQEKLNEGSLSPDNSRALALG